MYTEQLCLLEIALVGLHVESILFCFLVVVVCLFFNEAPKLFLIKFRSRHVLKYVNILWKGPRSTYFFNEKIWTYNASSTTTAYVPLC